MVPGVRTLLILLTLTGCATTSSQADRTEPIEVEPNALQKFATARSGGIRACYEAELKKNPNLRDTIVMLFTITPAGTATDVAVESDSFPSNEVATCVTQLVRQWVFPFKPSEETSVAYPFVFAPAS